MAGESNFDRIEAYLEQRLSSEEAEAFREELRRDPDLRQALLEHRLAGRAIELARADAVRARLDRIRQESGPLPAPVSRLRPLRILAAVASLLLLIVAGGFLYARLNFTDQALVDRYYQSATSSTVAGGSANADRFFEEGLYAFFREKDYEQAIESFGKVPANSEHYKASQYYLAHSEFRAGNYFSASLHFSFLLEARDLPAFIDRNELLWNFLLTRLAAGDSKLALRPLFNEIQNSATASPQLREKASQLQSDLDSLWRRMVD